VNKIHLRSKDCGVLQVFSAQDDKLGQVLVRQGKVVCFGSGNDACEKMAQDNLHDLKVIDLHGGSIAYVTLSFDTNVI
jgi:hypothetical protein